MQKEDKDYNEEMEFEIIGLDNFIRESKKKHFTSNKKGSNAKRLRSVNGITN